MIVHDRVYQRRREQRVKNARQISCENWSVGSKQAKSKQKAPEVELVANNVFWVRSWFHRLRLQWVLTYSPAERDLGVRPGLEAEKASVLISDENWCLKPRSDEYLSRNVYDGSLVIAFGDVIRRNVNVAFRIVSLCMPIENFKR